MTEIFAIAVEDIKLSIIFAKGSILDVLQGQRQSDPQNHFQRSTDL